MAQLVIWSAAPGEWLSCPPDEITWLDRTLLSAGQDNTLHRSPRCPGLRYVHYRWELFSRDTSHRVYVAPYAADFTGDYHSVQTAARHVLPMAPERYETVPVRLEAGAWLVAIGTWVLPLCIDVPAQRRGQPTVPLNRGQPPTQDGIRRAGSTASGQPGPSRPNPPLPGAVPRVGAFFDRNGAACLAIAYLYQEFVLGAVAPQAVPMTDVAIALDLSGEGAVSDYKKELQRRIWNEPGHQRELPEFLLANGLISQTDLDRAKKLAVVNERTGKSETARKRLRYRPKN
jgi:hypothetical protein